MKIRSNALRISLSAVLLLSILPSHSSAAEKKPYKRIVSLSPSATEDIFALGAGNRVVAVDDNSNFPENVPQSKLSSFNPNSEAIAKFRPDLVIIQKTATKSEQVTRQLQALNIKVYVEKTPTKINDVYREITELGKLIGRELQARQIIATIKSERSKALKKVRPQNLTFYHELDSSLYSATSSTFIGKVYADFGLKNIADAAAKADDGGYPQLQSEYVISANPDLIFLADSQYGESADKVALRTGWSEISAVKKRKIIELPPDIPSRWGPRIAAFYKLISDALS